MKILFVVNPISGGIDKEPFLLEAQTLCKKYGIKITIFKTTGQGDFDKLLEQIEVLNPDKVVSVGGDGTTLFSAVVLKGRGIPMGIVPLGSANGMAVELGVNLKPLEALKDIIMSEIMGDLDLLEVNKDHYSIHIGDVGVNAAIVDGYDKDINRGMATYAKYFVEALKSVTPFKMTIECNQEIHHEEGVMLGLCNARKYGTGVPLNLVGNPMDGMFEIVLVEKINTNTLIKAGLSSLDETFLDRQNQTVIRTDQAKITFNTAQLLQLDGEVIGKFKTLDLKLLKGAVKLISTTQNPYIN